MTNLPIVEAIRTSDGTLFNPSEYKKAVQHEKMVQAGIEYQNIIAGDYLREWLEENQDENAIDLISDPAIVSFATALLVAASDHKQAMNDDMSFCDSLDDALLVEGDEYALADELGDAGHGFLESPIEPEYNQPKELAELVKAKKASKPKKTSKQPKKEESNEADPLYIEAVELVRNGDIRPSGKALRERFGIRHDRASEIMKCMVADGVVSEPVKGVRTVL